MERDLKKKILEFPDNEEILVSLYLMILAELFDIFILFVENLARKVIEGS